MSLTDLRLREALRVQAIRDPLTGLYNRRCFVSKNCVCSLGFVFFRCFASSEQINRCIIPISCPCVVMGTQSELSSVAIRKWGQIGVF
ncbi:MAG: GGDEF domain-containing protein [Candidatus Electrothrix sp. AUS3]|nr:GGDEF domain-containing protein [Candidatus Electrothrix gigas]